jgi:hypothetical protein
MTDWIKKALTRTLEPNRSRKLRRFVLEPNPRLVLLVKFSLLMTTLLCILEIAHLVFLHAWNSEVFAGITGLIGTVTGVLIGRHV